MYVLLQLNVAHNPVPEDRPLQSQDYANQSAEHDYANQGAEPVTVSLFYYHQTVTLLPTVGGHAITITIAQIYTPLYIMKSRFT